MDDGQLTFHGKDPYMANADRLNAEAELYFIPSVLSGKGDVVVVVVVVAAGVFAVVVVGVVVAVFYRPRSVISLHSTGPCPNFFSCIFEYFSQRF